MIFSTLQGRFGPKTILINLTTESGATQRNCFILFCYLHRYHYDVTCCDY